jgi:large subunit ribosomal protein L16
MLVPKRLKWRKQQRGVMRGTASRGTVLSFGKFGLKALERGWVTAREIEAARRTIARTIQRGGAVWIRIFPDKPVTGLPLEAGLGGGKGDIDHFVARVLPGKIVFEMDGVTPSVAREALRGAGNKLSIKTKFIEREAK